MCEHTNSNEQIHHTLVSLWDTNDQGSSFAVIPGILITGTLQIKEIQSTDISYMYLFFCQIMSILRKDKPLTLSILLNEFIDW